MLSHCSVTFLASSRDAGLSSMMKSLSLSEVGGSAHSSGRWQSSRYNNQEMTLHMSCRLYSHVICNINIKPFHNMNPECQIKKSRI